MSLRWPDFTERRLTTLAWLAAVALFTLGALLGVRNEVAYRRAAVDQTVAQADILAASVTAALSFDDRLAMNQYVQALKANPQIGAAAVYDPAGRPLVLLVTRSALPPPDRAPKPGAGWALHRVRATRAASEQGQVLGYVYVQTQPDSLGAALARHTGVALLTVMGLLLLVLVSAAAAKLQDRAAELAEANRRLTEEIEARAEAEEALRQSQKMEALGQLTGGIAHDFNNLLQVMMAALDLIRRKAADATRVEQWATNALQAGERGASLTRQLLAFSRTQKLDLQPFVVSELVAGMRELLVRTLGPDIELSLELDEAGALVLSDRTQLELAILNLAINARDAMPHGGRLGIRTEIATVDANDPVLEPGDYVAVSVADTGEGMDPAVAQRAFDPFFTTKSVGKGTGLGLSQVYGVARQAGGGARIESVQGQGTTVTILLRCSADATPAQAPDADTRPVLALREGATILVVDDDDQVRRLLSDALQVLGYQVQEADGGAAAVDLLHRGAPDAMVVDFAMPQMNGAQVADRARALWPDLPILFASGHADTAAIQAAVGADAAILRKPFDLEALARALSSVIRPEPAEA